MRDLGDRRDIIDFERRIGRRFEEEYLGVGPHRLLPLIEVRAVDQRCFHPVARRQRLDHPAARAEQCLCRNDVVTGLNLTKDGG
jgi:hypothetical protein